MSRNQNQWFRETAQVVQSYTVDLQDGAWVLLGVLLALAVAISMLLSIRILLRWSKKADLLYPSLKR